MISGISPCCRDEEWKAIPALPGYEASSCGRILSTRGPVVRLHRLSRNRQDYRTVWAQRPDGVRKLFLVHRLILETFVGPRPEDLVTRHLDGTRDNHLANLRYGTRLENARDTIKHGQNYFLNLTKCRQGHAYDSVNTYVASDGSRKCRPCRAEAQRRYLARKALTEATALVHNPADDSFTVRQLTRNVVLDDHGLHGVSDRWDIQVAAVTSA